MIFHNVRLITRIFGNSVNPAVCLLEQRAMSSQWQRVLDGVDVILSLFPQSCLTCNLLGHKNYRTKYCDSMFSPKYIASPVNGASARGISAY